MQERHKEREQYFDESSRTCRKYYLPYICEHSGITPGSGFRVFEAGCGEGGNLAVFAELGCRVTGVDNSEPRIREAREIFAKRGLEGEFIHSDIFEYVPDGRFDLIILHDVIEHIGPKAELMLHLKAMLKDGGVLFAAFPPWQMPFGGHQQMASGKVVSRLPYIHLLPNFLYRAILRCGGSSAGNIEWFMDTKRTRTSIEMFGRLARESGFEILDTRLYFINPHYETKFGLRPRRLCSVLSRVPYLRNFFATSSFWLLRS